MKALMKKAATLYRAACIKSDGLVRKHGTSLLLVAGVTLLTFGLVGVSIAQTNTFQTPNYNDTLVRNAVGNLFGLIEGAFGALIMVVSGLGAIVAAAMGAYRAAVGMLVVAVGAFILRALVSLFFGENYTAFNVQKTS